MVEYDNPELFYDHESVSLIIVNSSAIITPVEEDAPQIENADFVITEDEITEDEITLRETLCGEENLTFGTLGSSVLTFDLFDSDDIPFLKDIEIDVYIYFNENSATLFKVGRYIVDLDMYSDDRLTRSIEAYDLMKYLRDFDITPWYNNIYKNSDALSIGFLRNKLFIWLNASSTGFGYTVTQETTTLVNDDWIVEKSIDTDNITFGFWMQRIAEINGVFPHINRDGVFCYKQMEWYDKPAKQTFDEDMIVPPVIYGGADAETTVWGIGYIIAYDKNCKRIAKVGSSNRKHPNCYYIKDSFVLTNELRRFHWEADMKEALARMREVVTHLRYKPFEGEFDGNLCLEVGDRIDINLESYDEENDDVDEDTPIETHFYSYILERTFEGLQEFSDIYSAKGDKKQPKPKLSTNWHRGSDGNTGTSGEGSSGISEVKDDFDSHYIEKVRNIGFRFLDEPIDVLSEYDDIYHTFKLKWEDPPDLIDNKPVPCIWAGTYVIRGEDYPPKNIYQGTILEDVTVRDTYKEDWFVDDTIEPNKHYYYAIMPYDTKGDVRYTKVLSVDTEEFVLAPTIEDAVQGVPDAWDGSEIAIMYSGDNPLTVQISNSHIVFKLYIESTEIYSFTSPVGSSTSDVSKIHVAFLEDSTNHIARPSFIYETGTHLYSYNQEDPLDEEMQAIYTWLEG